MQEHSGFICLDFDDVPELRDFQTDLINLPYVYACWVSPRGNGLKALVKIADTKKHREHFTALQEELNCDKSGINESRVCYESYDPDIYINTKAEPYKKFKKVEKVTEVIQSDEDKTIRNILTWLSNKGDAFVW